MDLPLYPAMLWGFQRRVVLDRVKCYRLSCITRTGTRYGMKAVCQRCARELAAMERNAPQKVGA